MSSQISVNSDSQLADQLSPEAEAVNTSAATNIDEWTGDTKATYTYSKDKKTETAAGSEGPETPPNATSENSGLFEIIRKYASLSDLLRLSGALAVAAAMGLFLLEGITVENDLQRFLTMLGLTGTLSAAGLFVSALLKEQSGSRVFISLALLSVPVNFTVIGALLYSVVPLDALALNYPGYAHWQVGSVSDLVLALVAGLAVLAPVIWLGFSVLARSARNWLSFSLCASCIMLVVPVRGELWSAAIAIASTLLLSLVCRRFSSNSLALRTTEGRFAVALLFVSPVIVAARSLFFYYESGVLLVTLSVGFYICFRQILSGRDKPGILSAMLTLLSSAAILSVFASTGILLSNFLSEAWTMFSIAVVLLLLSRDLMLLSPNRVLSGVIGVLYAAIATFVLVATAVILPGMTLWVSLVLIAIVAYGIYFKAKLATLLGGIGLVALLCLNASELLWHAQALWNTVLMTGWWGIAAIGVLAIVAGSMIDRAGTIVAVKEGGS